ncbi:MAG: RluA family pseudouridine synthase [Acidimicrobiaceae bacterium]|nr:RluA family pseudouridine synthase [Acidimicrobiaceae bacterium]MYG99819.1 RluA family pseudouridine synthase [Acidimicrobiaceae bacterium]MYL03534.1 RluA family pseudouridine synthase [Acidimicrobiaceae bacterium]
MSHPGEVVGSALDGLRLDRVVALVADVSRSVAARLVATGGVRLDGAVVTSGTRRVAAGESLAVAVERRDDPRPAADPDVAFETVLEDAQVVVVDKPAGLVVHPGAGHDRGTLVNGLLARYPDIADVGDAYRPGIVHRLDRGTSGLMVVARTERAYQLLVEQLRSHQPQRVYSALVRGQPEASSGVIDAPIGRSSRNPQRMTVTDRGRAARTGYTVEQRYAQPARAALLSCRLETGRTHQIRVHLRAIGHPVVGDPTYGSDHIDDVFGLSRPFLHARSLSFTHPASGETVRAESPLPPDLAAVLAACT